MANAHFYLPVLYFFHTRVTSGAARASWCLIYLVPLSLTLSVFSPDASWHAFVLLLSGCLAIYSVYELGYIENDTMTIRSEHKPTIRLSQTQMAYVDQHWYQIVVIRVLVASLLLAASYGAPGFNWFALALLCLIPTFTFYNRIRGRANALLHPLLVGIRFCAPLILLKPEPEILLFGFLLFPLLNSLERAAEARYQLPGLQAIWLTNQVSGRWSYYGILLAGLLVAWQLSGISLWLLLPVAYMLVYRVLTAYVRPEKVVR